MNRESASTADREFCDGLDMWKERMSTVWPEEC